MEKGIGHVHRAPLHPQAQGKIKRLHRSLNKFILLENYQAPGDLVAHHNYLRHCESIANLTPANVYFERSKTNFLARERINRGGQSLLPLIAKTVVFSAPPCNA